MSDGDGRKRSSDGLVSAAIVAIVLLAVAGVAISWGYSKQVEYYRNADQNSGEYTRNTYAPEADRCLILPRESQSNCIAEASNKERNYRRDEQDLAAQKTSAIWAYLMGSAALIGMILSAFGVFLVWRTFNATRESNEIAGDTAKRQLRAYIGIEIAMVESFKAGQPPVSLMKAKNFGQTPAYNIEGWIQTNIAKDFDDIDQPKEEFTTLTGVLDPTNSINAHPSPGWSLTQENFDAVNGGNQKLFVFGSIRYKDAFEIARHTKFCYFWVPSEGKSMQMSFSANGNEST